MRPRTATTTSPAFKPPVRQPRSFFGYQIFVTLFGFDEREFLILQALLKRADVTSPLLRHGFFFRLSFGPPCGPPAPLADGEKRASPAKSFPFRNRRAKNRELLFLERHLMERGKEAFSGTNANVPLPREKTSFMK
jgi:hypothetical protein